MLRRRHSFVAIGRNTLARFVVRVHTERRFDRRHTCEHFVDAVGEESSDKEMDDRRLEEWRLDRRHPIALSISGWTSELGFFIG
jgi:hypothetical protein